MLTGILLILTCNLHSQEICDNGIDDDGDTLIDLNDDECTCSGNIPTSLIPNPSFEEQVCCPSNKNELECAVGWIQASVATTDYVHTCGGFLNNPDILGTAPLPFPDGEGGVAFRDGIEETPNYKEYVGACLVEQLIPGTKYTFDFFVGFMDSIRGSNVFDIAVFASKDCADIPFGDGSVRIGCPVNTGSFDQLGEMTVSGNNEWINVQFEFVANEAYATIVLGPGCITNPNHRLFPYFYLDRLTLNKTTEFNGEAFESVTGRICDNNLLLQASEESGFSYQWYKDGIALTGETNSSLLLDTFTATEGTYLAVITKEGECFKSKEYNLRIPPYYSSDTVAICEGDQYTFGNDILTIGGDYERTIEASDGCDSIIQLNLTAISQTLELITDTICVGSIYTFMGQNFTEPGIYEIDTINASGCDSIITLDLFTFDSPTELEVIDETLVNLGESITIQPGPYDEAFVRFEWKNGTGDLISNDVNLTSYTPIGSEVIELTAFDIYGCSQSFFVDIQVETSYDLILPNIFSPNEDGINDRFEFFIPTSVERVNLFSVYNRWGNRVFNDRDIESSTFYQGWNGKIDGELLISGVYTYILDVIFLDGKERTLTGTITLIR